MNKLVEARRLLFHPPKLGTVLYLPGLPGHGDRIYDRSPYGNHGAITGAIWTRLPSGLWVLDFDGTNDVVTVTQAASINTLATFTTLFWAKQSVVTNEPVLFRKDARYFQMDAGGLATMRVPAATVAGISSASNLAITLDTWTFFATRYDNTGDKKIDILINGVECTYSTQTATSGDLTSDATANLLIGQYNNATTVKGPISLFRIVTSFMTDNQIRNIYYQERHYFGVW